MEKSIQVGNIKIRRSNVLDKGEKEQISLLVSVCNIADGTCNELFLTNEFNVYPEMPCFFRAYVEEGNTEPGLAGILIIYGDQEKMAEISAYVLPEQRGKGVFHALFHTALEYIRFFGYSELEFKTEKAYPAAGDILNKIWGSAYKEGISDDLAGKRGSCKRQRKSFGGQTGSEG